MLSLILPKDSTIWKINLNFLFLEIKYQKKIRTIEKIWDDNPDLDETWGYTRYHRLLWLGRNEKKRKYAYIESDEEKKGRGKIIGSSIEKFLPCGENCLCTCLRTNISATSTWRVYFQETTYTYIYCALADTRTLLRTPSYMGRIPQI